MNTTEAIRAAGGEIIFGGQVAFADESQFLAAAALVRPLAGEGARYKLLLVAEEFDGIADEYKQQGHDSGSESAKCRAYELCEIARTLAATPQAGSSNPAGMTEAQKETLLGLIKQVCQTDTAAPQPSPAGVVPDWIDEVINRRAAIEQELFNMVKRGENASPEQLRDIAIRLGTPRTAASSAVPLDAREVKS